LTAVTQPANGTSELVGSGVRYTPALGFDGSDSFTYTISDGRGGEAAGTVAITVTPPPSIHVGDIDAFTSKTSKNWSLRLRIYVHTETDALRQNVAVVGLWDNGTGQSCTTNRFGYCELSLVGIKLTVPTRSFTITTLAQSGRTYAPLDNHDPDGDSSGTSIVVARP
jgi:hypothetical protein